MSDLGSITNMVRSFLTNNPRLLETLVTMLYATADDLSKINTKAIAGGKYITPHTLKQKLVENIVKKMGYQMEDLPELCYQGRGEEFLSEVEKLEKPIQSGSATPSRRRMPSSKRPSTSSASITFEDISSTTSK